MTAQTDPIPESQANRGFTLVEVLAALAVFSIAALGLVQMSAENARTARLVEARALASLVADNRLAEVMTRQTRLDFGVQTDEVRLADRVWAVRETVQRTANPVINLVIVEVSAVETGRDPQPILAVNAFRRAGP